MPVTAHREQGPGGEEHQPGAVHAAQPGERDVVAAVDHRARGLLGERDRAVQREHRGDRTRRLADAGGTDHPDGPGRDDEREREGRQGGEQVGPDAAEEHAGYRLLTYAESSAGTSRPSSRTIFRSAASTTAGSWVATTTIAPRAASSAQLVHHVLAVALVELAGRLVGEQDLRRRREAAGTGDALHLAAGQLLDLAVAEVADVEAGQAASSARSSASAGAAPRARSAIATFSRADRIGTRP